MRIVFFSIHGAHCVGHWECIASSVLVRSSSSLPHTHKRSLASPQDKKQPPLHVRIHCRAVYDVRLLSNMSTPSSLSPPLYETPAPLPRLPFPHCVERTSKEFPLVPLPSISHDPVEPTLADDTKVYGTAGAVYVPLTPQEKRRPHGPLRYHFISSIPPGFRHPLPTRVDKVGAVQVHFYGIAYTDVQSE